MQLLIAARRRGYQLAYRVLSVYWFIARPAANGVKCVLSDGERVLLVRHTYGPPNWEVPGGAIKRRESAPAAARREMAEELGIDTPDWKPLGRITAHLHHRQVTLHCFGLERAGAELKLDRGEIDAAEWFPRTQLPPNLGEYVKEILDRLDR
jgi:8-oxo-dGTP pyrophosphatase MutT (NUDIX family)